MMKAIAIGSVAIALSMLSPASFAQWRPSGGVILSGTVVTMDDSFNVIVGGKVWIRNGKIESVLKPTDPEPPGAAGAVRHETTGYIYPGLIDLHNHPDYAAYPLLKVSRAYRDRYEWRFYDTSKEGYETAIAAPPQCAARFGW